MSRLTKAAVKKAEYDAIMAAKPHKSTLKPRWVWHTWDHEKDCLRTRTWIGAVSRPGPDWHREGSIDEIEAKENAGQRELFS